MLRFILSALLVGGLFALCMPRPLCGHGGGQERANGSYLDAFPRNAPVQAQTVIVKFRAQTRARLAAHAVDLPNVTAALAQYRVREINQMYPGHAALMKTDGNDAALDRMYRIEYSSDAHPLDVAKELSELPEIEYAEPEAIHTAFGMPNDPLIPQQYALVGVKAEEAWELTAGSRDVIIAIVDTGVLYTHEDLAANIWVNTLEDIDSDGRFTIADSNGVDDDGNGYIDDVVGIDFIGMDGSLGGTYYDNDPSPTPTGNPHGTHVAGIAAAVGNNGKGIAGIAYNCRIMPIKCGTDDGRNSVIRGYDGIVYAADNGAKVINCSWGGGGWLQNEIDRIDYAIGKGAVVIAAAGNTGDEKQVTPGAYPNVLCVANVDSLDRLNYGSTYGAWVDVSAPGTNILSTVSATDSSYAGIGWTGTSMASPCAAGIAALVMSHRPELTPRQVAAQVRVSTDDIEDNIPPIYKTKVGKGRVNAYKALTFESPALILTNWSYSDKVTGNGDSVLDRGERFTITMEWENLLAPTNDAKITLTALTPVVDITNPEFHAGKVGSNERVNNASDPFVLELYDAFLPNGRIELLYTIEDGEYTDRGGIVLVQQPSYRNHYVNNVTATLSNNGRIGFNDFYGVEGTGFIYRRDGINVIYEGALMIGAKVNGEARVVDVARDNSGFSQRQDFQSEQLLEMKTPGAIAPQEGYALFSDDYADDNSRLGVRVRLNSYEFLNDSIRNCVFLRYTITNTSTEVFDSLHAGLYFDWDVSTNANSDVTFFDFPSQTALSFDTVGTSRVQTRAGVAVLSRQKPTHYWAINNSDRDDTLVIGVYNGFTKYEKWLSMTSGVAVPASGITDVSHVTANGPYHLSSGDSVEIGFVLIAGYTNEEIIASVPPALAVWDTLLRTTGLVSVQQPYGVPVSPAIVSAYPNPVQAGSLLSVAFSLPDFSSGRIELIDVLGRTLYTRSFERLTAGMHKQAVPIAAGMEGLYFLRLISGAGRVSRSVMVRK